MRLYKTKLFDKWADELRISKILLLETALEITNGLIDVDLGGFLYKKRINIANKGKRGGARVILTYKEADRIIFLYGFAKNEKDNIAKKEKEALKKLATFYLGLDQQEFNKAIIAKELIEV